jgi:esterase/lipase
MRQESLLFASDYKKHFLAGETKPRHIGEPYLLHQAGTNRGVLLIHGLMAAPDEVRQWADFLYSQGYTVYAPRLAGHGTSAADLQQRSYSDWIDSVNRGHAILKTCCEQIVVAGFSTGAGLALHQALTKPDAFAAVISISAPLKFKSISSGFAEHLDHWNSLMRTAGIKRLRREFATNHPDNPHINYFRCPVWSIVQVKALMKKVYRTLPALSIPALIIQADNDPKVSGRSGRKIYDRISSPDKTYREVHFHLHGIVRGEISRDVFAEVATFLNRLAWRER